MPHPGRGSSLISLKRSQYCYHQAMVTIPQKELRNNVGSVLRRAEAGEELTITVAGRPVARLVPLERTQWVSGRDLAAVWATPAPSTENWPHLAGELIDPFEP